MRDAVQNIKNMQTELERIQSKLERLSGTLKFEQRSLNAPLEKITSDLDSMLDLGYDILLIEQGDYSTAVNDLTFTDQFIDLIISHLMHLQKGDKVRLTRQQDDMISNINKHLMHVQGSLMIVLNTFNKNAENN
ncbi:hypothetical protein [Ligilactobacillus acidipiscis]|uniref:hypothetical protein n=1 Tax=Ligilactobacillus acidipiscis TaxID=89059 RepID=UPI0022E23B08|nr:hypothetical protein [Ligilactobacillus acidipiscis]WEV57282.1 hypothetical protein OZX66_01695 [Ligilactobacillus acidipiscis]